MRVAFVSSHINKSLQFQWLHEEFIRLNVFSIHVIIQADKERPQLASDLEKLGIPVYVLEHKGVFSHITNAFKVKKLFKKHNIDIVHTTLPFGNLVGMLAAKLASIKKRVTTCENASWAHDFKSKKQELIDNFTFRNSIKIITGADTATEYLRLNWKLHPSKLVTIYHGIMEKEYENISKERIDAIKEQVGIKENDFVIGMIARLEFWKGHSFAIEAMKRVVKVIPNAKLMIFGSGGSNKDKILEQIFNSGIRENIMYKGFVNDPIALFQLFDIHLHIPVNKYVENCGINIIEGMISERPQILTLSGYSNQAARHMENAIVVDYCNSDQVADAILLLYRDKELSKKIAANARITALNTFLSRTKAEKHIELYSQL